MTQQVTGSLFAPANMSAGGFLTNVDAVIVSAKVGIHADTPFDPLGKDDEDSAYLILGFLPDDADDDTPKLEYYRMAVVSKITPSTDGKKALFQDGVRLNKSTKAGLLFASLVNAGFPVSNLPTDNSVGFLEGLHVHLDAVAMDIKTDGGKPGGKFKSDKAPQVTLITKLLEPKKVGAAKKTASAPKAASAPSSSAAVTGDTNDAIQAAVVDAIMAGGGTEKRLLPNVLMKSITDKALRTEAFKVIGKDEWLSTGPWDYDAGSGGLSVSEATTEHLTARG